MKNATLGCVGLLALVVTTAASAGIGRTAGTFEVSSTGTASYQIALWTPNGPKGMQPRLTLNYHSDSGNGILGVGWALDGLSSIDRCNSTVAQDGSARAVDLTIADRFCLGGNRLVLKSGAYGAANSTYRLEIDSDAATITAFSAAGNGPAYFQMKDRNGLTYQYGGTTDARATVTGVTTPLSWKLNKITDASGNTLVVQYAASDGYAVPAAIGWASVSPGSSNYIHWATFHYRIDRTDKDSITGRVASYTVQNRRRLESIAIQSTVDDNTQVVRSYIFTYDTSPVTQRSRLTRIQECGPSDCLSATVIGYQAGQSGVTIQASTGPSTSSLHKQAYDFNGDQRSDLLYLNGGTWSVAFAATGGYSAPYSTGIPSTTTPYVERFTKEGQDGILASVGGIWHHFRWNGSGFTSTTTGIGANTAKSSMADTNGDGLADLLSVNGSNQVYIRLNTTTGTAANPTFSSTTTLAATIYPWIDQTSAGTVLATSLNKGGLRRSDFDGDGRQDVYHVFPTSGTPSAQVMYSRNTTLDIGAAGMFTGGDSVAVRMNDDACTDFISGGYVVVMPCANTTASVINLPATPVVVLDWDGDGRTDLAVANGSTFGIYRSTGVGFAPLETTSIPYSANDSYFAFDQDGDTLHDIARVTSTAPAQFNYYTHTSNGTVPSFATNVPDLASSFTDGFGIAHSVGYISTGVGNYEEGPVVAGLQTMFEPRIVVAQVTSSDGTGTSYNKTYRYTGARVDEGRSQFVGFEQKVETDLRNNLVTKQRFQQFFPYVGRMGNETVYQANGVTPIRSKNFAFSSYGGSVINNIWAHPFVQNVLTREYEIAGAFSGQMTTEVSQSFEVDSATGAISRAYGTTTEPSTGNGLSSSMEYWFDVRIQQFNDFTNSCFGQPQVIIEQRSHDGAEGTMIPRTTELDWDGVRCRPRWKVVEGNDDDLRVTESYEYDNFGNINRLTVSPIGQPDRVATSNWGSTGQFLRSVTNPQGQTTTYDVDDYFGFVNSVTGPNGATADRIVYTRDQYGRVKKQTNSDGTSIEFTRTECDFSNAYCGLSSSDVRYSVTSSSKNTSGVVFRTSKEYFDGLDRTRATETPMLGSAISRVIQIYDSLGRPSSRSAPHVVGGDPVYYTTNHYDLKGRVTLIRRQENEGNTSDNDTVITYQGLTTTVTDARGKSTTYIHYATGAVARVTDPDGASTNYRYNAFGDIAKVINAYGVETTYGYNNRGMLTYLSDPDRGGWSYYYYPTGELKAQIDAKAQTVSFVYDKLSRPISRTEPEGTTTFIWDTAANGVGQLASATHSTMAYSESYVYDTLGRRQQMLINADGSAYAYDYGYDAATGQLLTLTYPQSSPGFRFKLRYGYENAILKSIVNYSGDMVGAAFWQADGLNARGQVTLETLGNGLITSSGYDRITGWLDDRTTGLNAGTSIQNLAYVWDAVGNLIRRTDYGAGVVEDFTYDNSNRLDVARRNSTIVLDMSYDLVGNITSKTGVGTYTYDPTKKHAVRSTSGAINNTFQYDANGNMTSRNGLTTTWYSYNMPNTINGASMSSQFFYGPWRARWKQRQVSGSAVSTLTYIGPYTERLVTSTVNEFRHYIYGPTGPIAVYKRNSAGTAQSTAYVATDHLGSTDVITNTAGANVVSMSFTAFGERKAADGVTDLTAAQTTAFRNVTRRGFTFHEHVDDLGVIHMNGRVYDPSIGRFLSPDPFVSSLYAPQNLNRYSYVLNNPLSATDPTGFIPCRDIFEFNPDGTMVEVPSTGCDDDWDPIPPGWYESPTYGDPTIGGGGVGGDGVGGPLTPMNEPTLSFSSTAFTQCINADGSIGNDNNGSLLNPNVLFGGLDLEGYLLVGFGIHIGYFHDRTTGARGGFVSLDMGGGLGASGASSVGVARDLSSFQGAADVLGAGLGPVSANYVAGRGDITDPIAASIGFGANMFPPPLDLPASVHASDSYTKLFWTNIPKCEGT